MHRLLERQLKRCWGEGRSVPEEWQALLQTVSEAYQQSDADRSLVERSLELVSQELLQKNQNLRRDLLKIQEYEHVWQEQSEALVRGNTELARQQRIMQGLLEDVEASKAELEEQRQWLEVSNQRLQQSYQQIKSAQLQLIQAEKLESVGRLAAGVSHEVKNPLAILLMGLEFLKTQTPAGGASETHQAIITDMELAVKRAAAVIRGMLDFSAERELQMEPADLNAIIEEALLLVKHDLTKSHIRVRRVLAEGLPQVSLDRQKMHQVFINLFVNAVHAMGDQGGELVVTTCTRELLQDDCYEWQAGERGLVRLRQGQQALIVYVDDTGSGIPPDQLSKIFDPFFTTKPTGQGTGLGLSVTQKIIEIHGGRIALANRPEGGVRATVLLAVEGGSSHGAETQAACADH